MCSGDRAPYGHRAESAESVTGSRSRVAVLLQLVPAPIGAFVLARELETGTFRYAWTQGFGLDREGFGHGDTGAG